MANVYFIEEHDYDVEKISKLAKQLLCTVIDKEKFVLPNPFPLKVHFGETGNKTYIEPDCYGGMIDYLEAQGIDSCFIETNVLYRGDRTTREKHLQLAHDHGFTRLPVVIADGDHGEAFDTVSIPGDVFTEVFIGKAFRDYEGFLVLSHFKGHEEAGFGGALKQLAMGFASRGGKMAQHATIAPVVDDTCIRCGACLEACDYEAITMEDFAEIHPEKCVGCAACVAMCPVGAIQSDWGAGNFTKRIGEYAYGAALGKHNLYLSLAFNITPYCDCYGGEMELIANNMGLFASTDPVALDRACLDRLQAQEQKDLFESGREALIQAEKLGLGTRNYQLIECR